MHKLKKLLIVSPNFPPVNAADMHRIRQMLFHVDATKHKIDILSIKPEVVNAYNIDPFLLDSLPKKYKLYQVGAISQTIARKIGIGSISIRSFFHFLLKGNALIRKNKYDLIFFSTTATHLMYLGAYWKKKFNIPFVLDIQDPWVNDYYLARPISERPPRFMFHYKLDSYLESRTIPFASAIISVSSKYNEYFVAKYNLKNNIILKTIPFGVEESDFLSTKYFHFESKISNEKKSIVYIGRGGHDLKESIKVLFFAFIKGLEMDNGLFSQIHFYFIGTSYAVKGAGVKTIEPLANEMGIKDYVTELTDRVSYFEAIHLLKSADILFIPGSIDDRYTPSKLYPYLLCKKPILAITNTHSEMNELVQKIGSVSLFHFNDFSGEKNFEKIAVSIKNMLINANESKDIPTEIVDKFSASSMSKKVFEVFDSILNSIESYVGH